MKPKINPFWGFVTLGLLLLTLSASAQLLHLSGDRVLPALPESQRSALARYEQLPRFGQQPRFAPRRAISVDPDRQTWWGYYPDDLISQIGLGSQGKDTYWAAIGIPASESIAQGKTIKAARFILDGTPGMKNFHFWIADHLPGNISEVALDIPVKTDARPEDTVETFFESVVIGKYEEANACLEIIFCIALRFRTCKHVDKRSA